VKRRDPQPGDLVLLTGRDWTSAWRGTLGIVLATYPTVRIRGQRLQRWRALSETGDMLVVTSDDVTIIQGICGDEAG
jgi:hypothetical protein